MDNIRISFKKGFISRMAERGITPDQFENIVKSAGLGTAYVAVKTPEILGRAFSTATRLPGYIGRGVATSTNRLGEILTRGTFSKKVKGKRVKEELSEARAEALVQAYLMSAADLMHKIEIEKNKKKKKQEEEQGNLLYD
jgi:hypothetical protein